VVDACRFILERGEPDDFVVAKVSADEQEVDAPRESPDEPATNDA
jgi:hypothetical protein